MSDLLTSPAPSLLDGRHDGLFHIFCCDENVALCGTDVTNEPIVDGPRPGESECAVCMYLVDVPCPDPLCPDRAPP